MVSENKDALETLAEKLLSQCEPSKAVASNTAAVKAPMAKSLKRQAVTRQSDSLWKTLTDTLLASLRAPGKGVALTLQSVAPQQVLRHLADHLEKELTKPMDETKTALGEVIVCAQNLQNYVNSLNKHGSRDKITALELGVIAKACAGPSISGRGVGRVTGLARKVVVKALRRRQQFDEIVDELEEIDYSDEVDETIRSFMERDLGSGDDDQQRHFNCQQAN